MKCRFILFVFACVLTSLSSRAQMKQIVSIAGNGETGYSGDGNSAVYAMLSGPLGVAVDGSGNVYIQDVYNVVVRKVSPAGIITTFAGNGLEGYSGDGGNPQDARVMPTGIATDKHGNLYITDAGSAVVRKVSTLGIITTVAGTGTGGYTGDGAAATAARLDKPCGIAVDTFDNLYITDIARHIVRKVTAKTGKIATIAGNSAEGYDGDGDKAILAKLDSPYSVAVDLSGNVFIGDYYNDVIRKVDTYGVINTYAGVFGHKDFSGNGGPATAAYLNRPRGVATDKDGNLYIADAENNVIRMVDPTGVISTVVGNGTLGFGGDGGYALGANLHNPYGVAIDKYGQIFVADANNQRVRKVFNPNLGVITIVGNGGVQLFPNPCADVINVAGLKTGDAVAVHDMAGRMVADMGAVKADGRQAFNVNNLAAGMYMLQVADASGSMKAVVKLVKE